MPGSKRSQNSNHNKKYAELLGSVAVVLALSAVVTALVSTWLYVWKFSEIEQINHRDFWPIWTCVLLWMPIAIQILVLWRLRRKVNDAISDEKLSAYFRFYFGRMGFSLLTYALLWLFYVGIFSLGLGNKVAWVFSWLPLVGIVVFLGVIVHATYLVTKTSFRDDELLLTEEEVSSSYEDIRKALESGNSDEVAKIRKWLSKDRDCKIHFLALKKRIEDLDILHLTEALNRLICNRRFYDAHSNDNPNPRFDLVPKEIEIVNRKYLNEHLGTPNVPRLTDTKSDKEDKKERSAQEKLARQQGQREGIALFPFYTMVFFFSLFLCMAYLFGFAFAFEDRYLQLTAPEGQLGLFMTDDLLDDSDRQPDPSLFRMIDRQTLKGLAAELHAPGDQLSTHLSAQLTEPTLALLRAYQPPDPISAALAGALMKDLNKLLKEKPLFDSPRIAMVKQREETAALLGKNPKEQELTRLNRLLLEDAYPDVAGMSDRYKLHDVQETFYFNSSGAGLQMGAPETASETDKYIARINSTGLDALAREVKSALNANKLVRLEVVGRADENAPRGQTYGSNQEIAASRVRIVRYAIQQKLLAKSLTVNRLASIDWIELPLSNDASLPPKRRPPRTDPSEKENNGFLVENDSSSSRSTSKPEGVEGFIRSCEDTNIMDAAKDPGKIEQIQAWWQTVREVAPPSKVAIASIYDGIQKWVKATDRAETNRLQEQIRQELYQLKDLRGSKRSVDVFLFESFAPRPSQTDIHSKRMALMDYLYFAMYTITTTGYGDIRPITPYSKFLCTVANMTEFFFIVVFFNTLLSLRRKTGGTD